MMPALATSTSTGPNSFSTWLNAASTESASVTSQATGITPSGAVAERLVAATRYPCACRSAAIAAPIPRDPPVTRATRPEVSGLME